MDCVICKKHVKAVMKIVYLSVVCVKYKETQNLLTTTLDFSCAEKCEHGECVHGTCKCDSLWTGPTCSSIISDLLDCLCYKLNFFFSFRKCATHCGYSRYNET